MGRWIAKSESSLSAKAESSTISHFSHPHPLQYSNSNQIHPCSACKLDASCMLYSCVTCNFFLHPECYQMPKQITHSFDKKNHVLSLLPKPIYPEGLFNCDACDKASDGFSYHCGEDCGIDLHITCASLPMLLSHNSHHHKLELTFAPPYHGIDFFCDICKNKGSKRWLYRCSACDFDVHLTCVATLYPSAPVQALHQHSNFVHQVTTRSISQPNMHNNMMPNNFVYNNTNVGPNMGIGMAQSPVVVGTPFQTSPQLMQSNSAYYGDVRPQVIRNTSASDGLMNGLVNGLASGFSSAATTALIQGIVGDGFGGN